MTNFEIKQFLYLLYSDGGTSFRKRETITIVEVKLSRTELRKNVTKPTWKINQHKLKKNRNSLRI